MITRYEVGSSSGVPGFPSLIWPGISGANLKKLRDLQKSEIFKKNYHRLNFYFCIKHDFNISKKHADLKIIDMLQLLNILILLKYEYKIFVLILFYLTEQTWSLSSTGFVSPTGLTKLTLFSIFRPQKRHLIVFACVCKRVSAESF